MNDSNVVHISSKRLAQLEYIEKNIDQIVADAVTQRLKSEQKQRNPKIEDAIFVSPSSSISSITQLTNNNT